MAMQQQLRGNWHEIKGALKKKWGQLTDQELTAAEGDTERLIGLIQRKTGETRDAIERFFENLAPEANSALGQAASTAPAVCRSGGRTGQPGLRPGCRARAAGLRGRRRPRPGEPRAIAGRRFRRRHADGGHRGGDAAFALKRDPSIPADYGFCHETFGEHSMERQMERQKQSTAASVTNRVTDQVKEGYDSAAQCVADHPGASVLVVFGVGFGMGMLLGHLLASPPPEERSSMARFGRQMMETMGRYVPEGLSKRLGC